MRASNGRTFSRREFGALTGSALAGLALSPACAFAEPTAIGDSRLGARPKPGVKTTAKGQSALHIGATRDGVLQMPAVVPTGPMPLMVLFHGAGGSAENQLGRFAKIPSEAGVAVLSLDSRGPTWDAIRGGFGPDVAFLDHALEQVFGQVAVDPARLTIGGFSDGATYALALGIINGDLFPKIAAFSPGYIIRGEPNGKPKVFISHGTADDILPIDRCSRIIVPDLKQRGYDVTFREFNGGHQAPAAARAARSPRSAAP